MAKEVSKAAEPAAEKKAKADVYVASSTFRFPADSDNQYIAGSDVSHLPNEALKDLMGKGHVEKA